ncbi:type 2 lanthipeptide synthetase LanM family protein [Catellatospora sp. NPDC049609]|uniref:type 2 lanthipeptide synthetase LanM family protein n=1 Tax=Catellatospora sp. NPDC049609 TaxID=3155505 RepID=UPI0034433881
MEEDSAVAVNPDDAAWFLACSLRERLAGTGPAGPVDEELGRIRLKMWTDEPVHVRQPDRLAAHLSRHGLDEAGLVRILGERPETVRSRFGQAPDYARRLADAWRAHRGTARSAHDDSGGFEAIAAPLVDAAVERLRRSVADLVGAHPHLSADTMVGLLGPGPIELINRLVARTMALELNVLRLRGELHGAGPHERYHHFLALLRRPRYALSVLREYPVLARDLVRAVDNWEASRLEFAQRLVADYAELARRCGGPDALGDLAEVGFGAGDSHRGGRSVAVVRFATGVRVVYKPRRLQVDGHFQGLLAWLNERGEHPALRTFWIVDRGGYGWTEYVAAGPCADRDALGRFYRRQGALLALLQVLGATDFHLENVIASGEHPMLIDLESMLHHWHRELPADAGAGYLPRVALELMGKSVTAVGLLPSPMIWSEDNQVKQFDLSGMAGAGGQLTMRPVATWEGRGTDEMRMVRRRVTIPGSANRPSLDGATPEVTEFDDEIISGYRSLYRTMLDHREALLDPAGPLAAFAHDQVRVVLRATESYARLLLEGQHPDLLRDALDRDRYHENVWSGHEGRGQRDLLIAAEIAQLAAGDVPIFVTTPSSTDLVGGDGTVLPGFLRRAGLDVVREQLAGLSEEHLAQQTWFIEASLTALVMDDPAKWRVQAPPVAPPVPDVVGPDLFVDAARLLGDRLLATALTEGERICWLGLNLVADRMWMLNPAGMDLYNGISGIALFLGQLARTTGDARYRRAADQAVTMMVREAETWLAGPTAPAGSGIGAFGALGGALYAFSHLAGLLDRADVPDVAARLARLMIHLDLGTAADEHDIIGGTSGGLLALLSLHHVDPDPALLAGARTLAARVVAAATDLDGGVGWRGTLYPDTALAGFSHGASGIATALARLDRRAGTHDYRATVDGALRFERALFDQTAGNWRDLRTDTPGGDSMVAWCHGAAGVALARAELLGYAREDALVRDDLRRALTALLAPQAGLHNHSICHGRLGNAEAALAAAQALGDDAAVRRATDLAASSAMEIVHGGWRCGVPRGVETPGLMSGLAGIGHALLRCADPVGVPSVLLLRPPADHRAAIDLP